jgi:hypothetical protein
MPTQRYAKVHVPVPVPVMCVACNKYDVNDDQGGLLQIPPPRPNGVRVCNMCEYSSYAWCTGCSERPSVRHPKVTGMCGECADSYLAKRKAEDEAYREKWEAERAEQKIKNDAAQAKKDAAQAKKDAAQAKKDARDAARREAHGAECGCRDCKKDRRREQIKIASSMPPTVEQAIARDICKEGRRFVHPITGKECEEMYEHTHCPNVVCDNAAKSVCEGERMCPCCDGCPSARENHCHCLDIGKEWLKFVETAKEARAKAKEARAV